MKTDTEFLRRTGLRLMKERGQPLERMNNRAQIYKTPDDVTVRRKTNMKRALLAVADDSTAHSRLNLENPLTDWILIVIPPRNETKTPAAVAYLVPTPVAVEAIKRCHAAWLASCPDTDGRNINRTLWFDNTLSSKAAEAGGFAVKWSRYRL